MTDTERIAEIRRRAITDFWDGTGSTAGHWWACHLCEWVWRDGQPEAHEPSCPLKGTEP